MKELVVVLVVALLVALVVAAASRVRGARDATGRATPAEIAGPEAPSPATLSTAPRAEPAPVEAPGRPQEAGPSDARAEEDPETQAAVAVIDVADRVHSRALTREEGLDLVRGIGEALPRGLHRGGPPLGITDVLGEVLRSIGEVTDLSTVDDARTVALVDLARSDAPTLRRDLAAAGTEELYDAAVVLFAAWAGPGEGAGSAT